LNNNPLIIIPMSVASVGKNVLNNRNIINNLSRQNQITHHPLPPVVCTILIKNDVVQNTTYIENLLQAMGLLKDNWIYQTSKPLLDGTKGPLNVLSDGL
jgi:hypothetical protein